MADQSFTTIVTHFQKNDPILHQVIVRCQPRILTPLLDTTQYFRRLCDEIISQQLSIKVAAVIGQRFEKLFAGQPITPQAVLAHEDQTLRDLGISWAKIKYLKDLASKVADGTLHLHKLPSYDNEQVIAELVQVKGIGRWTAEMFLMFTLGREDIYSHGDLGLKNAITKLYNLELTKDFQSRVEKITDKWTPYRTYGCLALWQSLEFKE